MFFTLIVVTSDPQRLIWRLLRSLQVDLGGVTIYILSVSKLVKIVFNRVLKVKHAVCESYAENRSTDLKFFALVFNRITAITHVVCVACAGS